ncbi:hypothetical protein FRC12_007370 [Ceratobasidium sp. 428]|nr:hypothetical protein FRC12_007370 [Ceratobasidium sp. 428]
MVLGIARADSTQLGFDPDFTLTIAPKPTYPQHDITVHSSNKTQSVYRTVKTLRGRGQKSHRAWNTSLEGTKTGRYRKAVGSTLRAEGHLEYSRYCPTVFDAGFALVHTGRSSQPDDIKPSIRRGKDVVLMEHVLQPAGTERRGILKGKNRATATSRTTKRPKKSSGSPHCTPTTPQVGNWDYSNINESPYRRCQTVSKEIGEPIHCLRRYQDVVTAIRGASNGLQAIHTAGYAHHDVSSGNIILVPDGDGGGRRGVIIDLEYTKEVSNRSDFHGVEIGAYEFMAIEVALSEYLHSPPRTINLSEPFVPRASPPPFHQNQLHDLESIWWICMWTAFQIVGPGERPTSRYLADYNWVFQPHQARGCFWALDGIFASSTTHISNPSIIRAMGYWRQQLRGVTRNLTALRDLST